MGLSKGSIPEWGDHMAVSSAKNLNPSQNEWNVNMGALREMLLADTENQEVSWKGTFRILRFGVESI